VEKSADGLHFNSIGEVVGAGNSDLPLHYKFLDQSPNDGYNFYRLRQMDFNGKTTYSGIEMIRFDESVQTVYDLRIAPNPFKGMLEMLIPADVVINSLEVRDMSGRIVFRKNGSIDGQVTPKLVIDLSDLSQGVYYLNVNSELALRLVKTN
jgi:hypothetical protein